MKTKYDIWGAINAKTSKMKFYWSPTSSINHQFRQSDNELTHS